MKDCSLHYRGSSITRMAFTDDTGLFAYHMKAIRSIWAQRKQFEISISMDFHGFPYQYQGLGLSCLRLFAIYGSFIIFLLIDKVRDCSFRLHTLLFPVPYASWTFRPVPRQSSLYSQYTRFSPSLSQQFPSGLGLKFRYSSFGILYTFRWSQS